MLKDFHPNVEDLNFLNSIEKYMLQEEEETEKLIKDIGLILITEGQQDKKFKLGEIIKYNPSEVMDILRKHKDELRQLVDTTSN